MNANTMELVTWTLGTVLGVITLAGVVVRVVLVPYLREHLVAPVQQVRKQVTENHHSNSVPTVLDRIDDVQQAVNDVRHQLGEHLEASNVQERNIWRAIGRLEGKENPS